MGDQQTSGRTYYTGIMRVEHRSQPCSAMEQSNVTCRQGAFPNEPFNDNWAWGGSSGGDGTPPVHECMAAIQNSETATGTTVDIGASETTGSPAASLAMKMQGCSFIGMASLLTMLQHL